MDTQQQDHHDEPENQQDQPIDGNELTSKVENMSVEPVPGEPEPSVLPAASGKSVKSKKKYLIAAIAVAILAVGAGTYLFVNKDSEPVTEAPTQTVAKLGVAVTLIDGTAQYSSDGEGLQDLTTEYQPEEGDTIKTAAASRVILTLDDGSVIRLDESTTVKLTSLSADDVKIDNEAGDVYSRVVTSERLYTVNVDDASYQALGTAFNTVNTETTKGVQTYQSSVAVEGTDTKVEEGKQFFKTHTNSALAMVVSDIAVDEMKSDGFMIWNLEQDKQDDKFKDKLGYLSKIEEQPAPAPAPAAASASIKLTAKTSDKGVVLSWSVTSISGVEGYKVVRSKKTATPTYGKDDSQYASGDKTRTLTWKDGSGVTYTYRVCAYTSKTCSTYSNAVTVASPYTPPEAVVPGAVDLTITGTNASWTFAGTAPHGFKIVVGNSANPSYGDNIKKYYSSNSPFDDFDGLSSGTYHVRVCKYTADSTGCTDYSDDETLIIP